MLNHLPLWLNCETWLCSTYFRLHKAFLSSVFKGIMDVSFPCTFVPRKCVGTKRPGTVQSYCVTVLQTLCILCFQYGNKYVVLFEAMFYHVCTICLRVVQFFCIYNIIVDHALWWVQFGALHLLVLVNFSSANWTNESLIGAVRRTKTSGTTKTVVKPWFKNLTGPSMHNLGLLSTHLGRFSFFAGLMANRQASRPLYICSDRLCLMLCIAVWPNYNSQICIVP